MLELFLARLLFIRWFDEFTSTFAVSLMLSFLSWNHSIFIRFAGGCISSRCAHSLTLCADGEWWNQCRQLIHSQTLISELKQQNNGEKNSENSSKRKDENISFSWAHRNAVFAHICIMFSCASCNHVPIFSFVWYTTANACSEKNHAGIWEKNLYREYFSTAFSIVFLISDDFTSNIFEAALSKIDRSRAKPHYIATMQSTTQIRKSMKKTVVKYFRHFECTFEFPLWLFASSS